MDYFMNGVIVPMSADGENILYVLLVEVMNWRKNGNIGTLRIWRYPVDQLIN